MPAAIHKNLLIHLHNHTSEKTFINQIIDYSQKEIIFSALNFSQQQEFITLIEKIICNAKNKINNYAFNKRKLYLPQIQKFNDYIKTNNTNKIKISMEQIKILFFVYVEIHTNDYKKIWILFYKKIIGTSLKNLILNNFVNNSIIGKNLTEAHGKLLQKILVNKDYHFKKFTLIQYHLTTEFFAYCENAMQHSIYKLNNLILKNNTLSDDIFQQLKNILKNGVIKKISLLYNKLEYNFQSTILEILLPALIDNNCKINSLSYRPYCTEQFSHIVNALVYILNYNKITKLKLEINNSTTQDIQNLFTALQNININHLTLIYNVNYENNLHSLLAYLRNKNNKLIYLKLIAFNLNHDTVKNVIYTLQNKNCKLKALYFEQCTLPINAAKEILCFLAKKNCIIRKFGLSTTQINISEYTQSFINLLKNNHHNLIALDIAQNDFDLNKIAELLAAITDKKCSLLKIKLPINNFMELKKIYTFNISSNQNKKDITLSRATMVNEIPRLIRHFILLNIPFDVINLMINFIFNDYMAIQIKHNNQDICVDFSTTELLIDYIEYLQNKGIYIYNNRSLELNQQKPQNYTTTNCRNMRFQR